MLKAESLEEAQDWTGSDPVIKAGRLVAEMHGPWDIDPSAISEPETTQSMEQCTLVLLKSGEKWNPSALFVFSYAVFIPLAGNPVSIRRPKRSLAQSSFVGRFSCRLWRSRTR